MRLETRSVRDSAGGVHGIVVTLALLHCLHSSFMRLTMDSANSLPSGSQPWSRIQFLP